MIPTGSRILVCGGRDFVDRALAYRVLDDLAPRFVLVGANENPADDCGADLLARDWCRARGVVHFVAPAMWKHDGRMAGPRRNKAMAWAIPLLGIRALVAFPGGSGTEGMVREALKADPSIAVLRPQPPTT